MINIVLFEPEIPQNTGNIMRTCVAFEAKLHLIKPLGFEMNEKRIKRSGMDYIDNLNYEIHENWKCFYEKNKNGQYVFLTRYGLKHFGEFEAKEDADNYYLVFGKESTGIDKNILVDNIEDCYRIPMEKTARSLNLSNCVALATYELLRQLDFPNLSKKEQIKGEDFLKKFL